MNEQIQQIAEEEKKTKWWIFFIIFASILVFAGILSWLYIGILRGGAETKEIKQATFSELIEGCQKIESGRFEGPLMDLKNSCIKSVCSSIDTEEKKIQECMEREDIDSRDYCLISIIPSTIETCNKISSIDIKDQCFMSIATMTLEVCDSISDSNYTHNTPKTFCYRSIAEKEGNDLICDKINDDIGNRISCYVDAGIIKKDSKICEKINLDYLKNWCSKTENSNTNICVYDLKYWLDKDFIPYKNHCLGVVSGDTSKCGDEETIIEGKSYCYLDIAKNKNDLSICDMIESKIHDEKGYDVIKRKCYIEIADLRNDSSLCDRVIIKNEDKNSCYLSAAKKIDISLCEKLSGTTQVSCYSQIAKEVGDISLCNRIPKEEEMMIYSCFQSIIQSSIDMLNKNFTEEEKLLYDICCKSPYDCKEKNESEESVNSSCQYKKGEYEKRVYDSQGRVTGIVNGKEKREIPDSFLFTEHSIETEEGTTNILPAEIILYNVTESYIHEIFCLKEGNYVFTTSSIEDEVETNFEAINIPISPGVTHRYSFNWSALANGEEGATILIDENNDRIFEKNITAGQTLTCEDFKLKTNKGA